MLTRRSANPIRFTRGDVPRIVIATLILVAALTAMGTLDAVR